MVILQDQDRKEDDMNNKIKFIRDGFFINNFIDSRLAEITSIEWSVAPYAIAIFFDYSNEWQSNCIHGIPVYRGCVLFDMPIRVDIPVIESIDFSIIVGIPINKLWSKQYILNNKCYMEYNIECEINNEINPLQIISRNAYCFTSIIPWYVSKERQYSTDLDTRIKHTHSNCSNLDFYNFFINMGLTNGDRRC